MQKEWTPVTGTYWQADKFANPTLHVYISAGLCIAFYLMGQTIGTGLGSSSIIGTFFIPSTTSKSRFHTRFSVLSSVTICLVVLMLVCEFRRSSMIIFARTMTALFSGLATRIASRRVRVKLAISLPPSHPPSRVRLRSYSHVFGGALNMGDDADGANEEDPVDAAAKKSKYDDSGLPARVSSGAVRVYLAGMGCMAFASGGVFQHFHPEPSAFDDTAADGAGWVRVNSDGAFTKPGTSELFKTNFQGHSFLFMFTLFSLSMLLCSYILRVFYRAEVVAGKKHGQLVEVYAMKAALAFVCSSLGVCCNRQPSPSSPHRQSRTDARDDDLEAGIPLMPPASSSTSVFNNRNRARTNTDEFFDATSHEGDLEDSLSLKSSSWDSDNPKNSGLLSHPPNSTTPPSVYSNRKCVDTGSGKVSNVPPGIVASHPPKNFIKTCTGDRSKAMKMFQTHLAWRLRERIGSVHTRPHSFYSSIKHYYPHFIHGHSKDGFPVVYEQPGKMDLKSLFKRGCTIKDMVHHFVYHMEYLAHVLRPKIRKSLQITDSPDYEPLPGLVVVMDVKGMSITQLNGDVISYLKAAGDMTNNNYPGCQHRMLVVNAPFWFSGAWGGVKNVMPKETQEAACVRSSNFIGELTKHIHIDQIPMEYGGSNMHAAFNHPYEVTLKSFVEHVTSGDGHDEDTPEVVDAKAASTPKSNKTTTPMNAYKDAPEGQSDERHFTFDHVAQKWVREAADDEDENNPTPDRSHLHNALKAGSWKTELTTTATTPDRGRHDSRDLGSSESHNLDHFNNPVRRVNAQQHAYDEIDEEAMVHVGKGLPTYAQALPGEEQSLEVSTRVLGISSVLYFFSCALQTSSETMIPFWLLIGNYYGGLSYCPYDVGKLVLFVCLLLIGMSMRRVLRRVARLPNRSPLRAFRIGIGSQAFAFFFLPVIPIILKGGLSKNSSWAVWISTIIVISALVLTTTLSRASSAVLHRIASTSYSDKKYSEEGEEESMLFGLVKMRKFFASGGATSTVSAVGEVAGALFGAYIFVKAVQGEHSYPFDSSSLLLGNCLISTTCYFLSLALHVNIVGDYGKDEGQIGLETVDGPTAMEDDYCVGEDISEKAKTTALPSRCGLWGEIFNIPAQDLAVLIEQATWR